MPDNPPRTLMDVEHWTKRFDDLVALVKRNAELARNLATDAATNAAIKVAAENARAQQELRQELLRGQAEDRRVQQALHHKVDTLGDNLTEAITAINKLSTAKLIQLGITSLILAALVIIGIKALGG